MIDVAAPSNNPLRSRNDRITLLVCIGIAFVCWVLNRLSTTYRAVETVTLDYQLPPRKVFSTVPTQKIRVTVQGRGWDLLTRDKIQVAVPLTTDTVQEISSGYVRSLLAESFGTRAEVINLDFEKLTLYVENTITRTLPVAAVTHLTFAKGYDLAQNIELNPKEVTVEGPKSLLDQLSHILTDTLRIKHLNGTVTEKMRLQTHPLLHYNIAEVSAKLVAEQLTEIAMFIPVTLRNAPPNTRVFPNKIKLSCTLGLNQYKKVSYNDFVAEVDLRGIEKNKKYKNNTAPIVLTKQPQNIQNLKFTPKLVEFYFESSNEKMPKTSEKAPEKTAAPEKAN